VELSDKSVKLYVNSFHYKVSSRTIQPARTKIITNTRINTNESGKPFVLRPFSTIPNSRHLIYRWCNIIETRTSRTETPTTRLQHSKNTNSTSRTAVSTTTHSSPILVRAASPLSASCSPEENVSGSWVHRPGRNAALLLQQSADNV
jgi:hypothetical protein